MENHPKSMPRVAFRSGSHEKRLFVGMDNTKVQAPRLFSFLMCNPLKENRPYRTQNQRGWGGGGASCGVGMEKLICYFGL
jgi:hypothetical protein